MNASITPRSFPRHPIRGTSLGTLHGPFQDIGTQFQKSLKNSLKTSPPREGGQQVLAHGSSVVRSRVCQEIQVIRNLKFSLGLLVLAIGWAQPMAASAQIRIGQTAGFTGPASSSVEEVKMGATLYIDHVNRDGGIAGKRIELVSLDDETQAAKSADNARRLAADPKVLALFLNRGTPQTRAIMPVLTEYQIPLIAPSTGAMSLHQPVNPWIFNVRTTYQREAENIVRHLGLTGLEKVGVLYVDDVFGLDAVEGARRVFTDAGKPPAFMLPISRDNPDYNAVVPIITEAKPMGILIVGSAQSVATGMRLIRQAGSKARLATLSNNATIGFVRELGTDAAGVIVSQVFPSERSVAAPLVAELLRLSQKKKMESVSPAMVEGFAAAKVLVMGLKRAAADSKNKDITRTGLKQALESLNKVDLGGMDLGYSPTDHSGLDFVDLSIISADGHFRR